ncbi:GH92 family glycosyl hydrolase [Hyunsoonleella pacifica]|uniref:Glycoside hydrolase family 92 protein n=1 Tax=Hyunsoonleella pacifica TaxID=1080224 RepID=A0A4Q9FS79_9FLAO|nr:GH92 family glycosyl hydrolase [Hyunsoonleella pacifica]TBN18924.1 glycoside hydrolase family 92 protein [Hyunsoonleella pacifica]GGD05901.1 alpha-1,2-mannosidase [Hyunsoonleella pacifica]
MIKPHFAIILFLTFLGCKRHADVAVVESKQNVDYINPFICTADDHGQTDVSASVPFGMVKPGPDTNPIAHSGYDYMAKEIIGFSNTRFSGVGCRGVGGNLRVLPFVISEQDSISKKLRFKKESETALAGYYKVDLNNGVTTELTGTRQVAFHKYTFPESENSGISIDLASSFVGHVSEEHQISKGIISGKVTSINVCKKGKYTFYYALALNKGDIGISNDSSTVSFQFKTKKDEEVVLRVALSSVSKANASYNLIQSLNFDFETVKNASKKQWNDLLDVVDVETKNDSLKTMFYTHLYHATQSPFMINDDNGEVRGSDNKLYNSKTPTYHGWSIWDTFRTKLPLFSLVYPERYQDMLLSLKRLYKQGKPDWATETEPFLTIRTEHSMVMLLDAYRKGILPFDLNEIYDELKEEAKHLPFKSPDNVLESSYDLWALSEISEILGKDVDAEFYRARAFEYKTTWENKFMNMDENSDVMHGDGLYEGTLWQYRWFVPFDMQGIQTMMGGKDEFENQLDYFFDNELFNIGNQPDIQVPYLYNYTNSPWKTQQLVDKLLNKVTNNWYGTHEKFETPIVKKIFTATPNGYIKEMDDDAGTMSSWYVWSTMGLYPLFPGSTQLALTVPQFDKITIKTKGKPLEIIINGRTPNTIYIQKVTWNGAEINSSIIDFNLISKGGVLQFELTDMPNTLWGKQN